MTTHQIDNTRHLTRLFRGRRVYAQMTKLAMGKVPVMDLARYVAPRHVPVGKAPPLVTIELSNLCNLSCGYCSSPLGLRPKGFMPEKVFRRIVEDVDRLKLSRVRIVGVGEPTLHPEFPRMMDELGQACSFLQIVTNGHWRTPEVRDAMLRNCATIAVSVEGASAEEYERSRVRGRFERLLENLRDLKSLAGSDGPMIVMRIMIRPSQENRRDELSRFWAPYCHASHFSQLLDELGTGEEDLYSFPQKLGGVPRCNAPFLLFQVIWDGTVSLCGNSQFQVEDPRGLVIGNVVDRGLDDLWHDEIFKMYRRGHAKGDNSLTPICSGCHGY